MPTTKPAPSKPAYSALLQTALQQGSQQVEAMHRHIAAKPFALLQKVPVLALPALLVQRIHDRIVGGVYGAVRKVGGGALELVGQFESPPAAASSNPIRSALNGVFGDHLQASGNTLAFEMAFYTLDQPEALSPAQLAAALAGNGGRLAIFIHGLACDEHCWAKGGYGAQLQRDFGYLPIYLRYNSGLSIAANAVALAELLGQLYAAQADLRELVLIGHSMGGLLARSASYQAGLAGMDWLAALQMVICLGSPHRGAPLERLGRLVTVALQVNPVSSPLARIALQRSQGVQDLRDGLLHAATPGQTQPLQDGVAYRFVAASLLHNPRHPAGQLLGDGLVPLPSASDADLPGDVQSAQLGGVGHMALLHQLEVYQLIHQWLSAKASR